MFDSQCPRSASKEELRPESENQHLPGRVQGKIGRRTALRMLASTAGAAMLNGGVARRALSEDAFPRLDARLIAINIPGASAIAQIGTFLPTGRCSHPIP